MKGYYFLASYKILKNDFFAFLGDFCANVSFLFWNTLPNFFHFLKFLKISEKNQFYRVILKYFVGSLTMLKSALWNVQASFSLYSE